MKTDRGEANWGKFDLANYSVWFFPPTWRTDNNLTPYAWVDLTPASHSPPKCGERNSTTLVFGGKLIVFSVFTSCRSFQSSLHLPATFIQLSEKHSSSDERSKTNNEIRELERNYNFEVNGLRGESNEKAKTLFSKAPQPQHKHKWTVCWFQ